MSARSARTSGRGEIGTLPTRAAAELVAAVVAVGFGATDFGSTGDGGAGGAEVAPLEGGAAGSGGTLDDSHPAPSTAKSEAAIKSAEDVR
jgi:hypothetical protein